MQRFSLWWLMPAALVVRFWKACGWGATIATNDRRHLLAGIFIEILAYWLPTLRRVYSWVVRIFDATQEKYWWFTFHNLNGLAPTYLSHICSVSPICSSLTCVHHSFLCHTNVFVRSRLVVFHWASSCYLFFVFNVFEMISTCLIVHVPVQFPFPTCNSQNNFDPCGGEGSIGFSAS